jgi:hypothetical protein
MIYLVIAPKAGSVPGMHDEAKFAAPNATNSLFKLIE